MHSPGWSYFSPNSDLSSDDAEKPISAGFYRLEAGKELVYPYTYNEMKIILEGFRLKTFSFRLNISGEFTISDETGYKVTAKPGDVFYFEKGMFCIWSY
jgi:ethanolamine utilization protein EutQ (cupin superfamily)